jgi:PAS domain S-box-containing protein
MNKEIEQRRSAEDLLGRSERDSLIVDSIPAMICVLSANGELEFMNRQGLEYFGLTLEDMQRWQTGSLTHPDDLAGGIEHFARSISEGTPWEVEVRGLRFDGVYRWTQTRGSPLRDENGRIVRWYIVIIDIDERKRAEDALRESERESRLIVNSIPGFVAVFTATGEVEFVNRPILEFFGQTLEDLKRWGTGGMTHPEDLPRAVELFARSMASGDPFEFEVRARRFDGVYRWFQSSGFPLRDTHGHIVRWYNLLIDIDERKRAEQALVGSERNLKLIIDTMPAFAWSTTPDGAADFFNQHYLDYVGLSTEQASGWGWTSAIHPDDLNNLADTWQRCLRDGLAGEAEARMRRRNGEYRWFLLRASPQRDESGAIVKWYGVNADIEDRKRAEAELRRTYTYLVEAQRLSHCGSFFTDFTSNERIWSDELFRIFEIEPATKVTGQLLRTMVHPEDLPLYDAEAARLQAGHDIEVGFRILTTKGALKHVRTVCRIVEWKQGGPVCFGAVLDVTNTVIAEEALDRVRSQLAHVTRVTTLSTLTASITHEVSQPLTGIITSAGACLRMLDADPPNVQGTRDIVKRITRDGHRLSEVITRLRALFSKREFTLESLDLNEAVQEVIAMSLGDLQRHRVIVQSTFSDDLPPVMGDRIQLQQVVLNLLRNASDAMVGVEDRPRHLRIKTERDDGDRVRVIVCDSGMGIDPQNVDRVFDAFYTTKSSGMGIGLAVSRSIIERHQGRLWAEPNDGPGATFAFSIPNLH